MHNIRLQVAYGEYSNPDAYYYVLNYIYQKHRVIGCGFTSKSFDIIVQQFLNCKLNSHFDNERLIWHFFITSSDRRTLKELVLLEQEICQIFSPSYQVLCGIDNKKWPHLHCAVNAFGLTPDTPILNDNLMDTYLNTILRRLHMRYPYHRTIYKFN